jgi:hypothetical protein
VTRGRHSLAPQKSKNRRVAYLAAPLVTCAVVGVGVAVSGSASKPLDNLTSYAASDLAAGAPEAIEARSTSVSRDAERQAVTELLEPEVTGRLWTLVDLNLRATPEEDAKVLGEVEAITRVRVTGERSGDFAQIVVRDKKTRTIAWVTAEYLVRKKPTDPAHLPLSDAPCPDGSVENGLTDGAVRLYRSVCHAFPQVTQYGGWDAHGEHSSGRALDIMTSDVQLGNAIAAFLQAHAAELNIFDVIWRQQIWTTQRAGDGWRSMEDRGSSTANHYDHVHVSVY